MYIDNVTELAFDDVTPEDPDFPFIQGEAFLEAKFMYGLVKHHCVMLCHSCLFQYTIGLAEAGLISSKLSRSDMNIPEDVHDNHILFSPER